MENATIFPFLGEIKMTDGSNSQGQQIFDLMTHHGIRVKRTALEKATTDGATYDAAKSFKKYAPTGNEGKVLRLIYPQILDILHPPNIFPDHDKQREVSTALWVAWDKLIEVLQSGKDDTTAAREDKAVAMQSAAQ
jgi:hypothetical protein